MIVVEHDQDAIMAADHILDVGPGAGIHGGQIIAEGPLDVICKNKESITGDYLSGKRKIEVPKKRHTPNDKYLEISGGRGNNLKNISLKI